MTAPLPTATTAYDDAARSCNKESLAHSMRDGIVFSLVSGAGASYLSAYALFLKATAEQIALLASVPPLIGSAMQLVSCNLGDLAQPVRL
jgi:hypothetical protein